MIHRKVLERLGTLAEFIRWDDDPYMVITEAGRLELDRRRLHDQRPASLLARGAADG